MVYQYATIIKLIDNKSSMNFEDELEEDDLIEVLPGIYLTKEEHDANVAYDEARDNEL